MSDYTLKRAVYYTMKDPFFHDVGQLQPLGRVRWHPSIAVLMSHWFNYHLYHFLVDGALGAMGLFAYNPDIYKAPREAVYASNFIFNGNDKGPFRLPWNATLQVLPVLSTNHSQPVTVLLPDGPQDNAIHCYCQLILIHSIDYKRRWNFLVYNPEATYASTVATARMRQELQEMFSLPAYDAALTLWQVRSSGLWKGATSIDQPRLLYVMRAWRQNHRGSLYIEAATRMGYVVESIHMENFSVAQQVRAMRFADVVMGVHGAGLTFLLAMNTVGPNSHCRTVIELMPWAAPHKIPFYSQLCLMANVSSIRVDPKAIHFPPNVPVKLRDQIIKSKTKPWSGAFHGFHVPHTLSYRDSDVLHALNVSLERTKLCKN
jgi:hypothetical protein